jgi:hypothetical protein
VLPQQRKYRVLVKTRTAALALRADRAETTTSRAGEGGSGPLWHGFQALFAGDRTRRSPTASCSQLPGEYAGADGSAGSMSLNAVLQATRPGSGVAACPV